VCVANCFGRQKNDAVEKKGLRLYKPHATFALRVKLVVVAADPLTGTKSINNYSYYKPNVVWGTPITCTASATKGS